MNAAVRFYSRKELRDTLAGWKDVMPTIQNQIDHDIVKVPGIACKPGCAHCCKLMVTALPHEVMEVVDYIRFSDRFSRSERAVILDRLKFVVEQTDGMDEYAYRAANLNCPFLSDDNRCQVYAVRPIACRAFGSTRVEVCELSVPDDGSTFKVVPNSLMRLLATSGLFFTPFLKSCLDWWHGFGIESPTAQGEPEAVAEIQRLLDAGKIGVGRVEQ